MGLGCRQSCDRRQVIAVDRPVRPSFNRMGGDLAAIEEAIDYATMNAALLGRRRDGNERGGQLVKLRGCNLGHWDLLPALRFGVRTIQSSDTLQKPGSNSRPDGALLSAQLRVSALRTVHASLD
ncbi:hypothetical protein C2E31_02990 [Rhodopirellula baltica]|nr:hypothetical protein C2E31_02990 [Rhodopirellula baltica]